MLDCPRRGLRLIKLCLQQAGHGLGTGSLQALQLAIPQAQLDDLLVQIVCSDSIRLLPFLVSFYMLVQIKNSLSQSSLSYIAGSYCHQSWPRWFSDLTCSTAWWLSQYSLIKTLNAWENILRHDCGLHIAHVHKNPCGSRDFPNQALLFLNCTPISFFAASLCLSYVYG